MPASGDSAGDAGNASVSQWTGDVVTAVHELAASRDLREISAVGLRLGGTLAALAAQQCDCIDRLVLWEPVIDGASTSRRSGRYGWTRNCGFVFHCFLGREG